MDSKQLFAKRLLDTAKTKKHEQEEKQIFTSQEISKSIRGLQTTAKGQVKIGQNMNDTIRNAFGVGITGRTIREKNRQKLENPEEKEVDQE